MDRVVKFFILGLIIPVVVTIIGITQASLLLASLGIFLCIFVALGFLYLNLLFRRKKKTNWRFEKMCNLQLLEETDNKFFVIKKVINLSEVYIFSYKDENGKDKHKVEHVVKLKKKDKEKPYVIIYKNTYEPKGVLDYIFYDNSIKEYYEYRYDLYATDDEVRFD